MTTFDELPKTPRKSVNWDTMDIEDCAKSYAKAHPKQKEKLLEQLQFIMGCVGYAIGLGNLWRFPVQVFNYGGGAFVVAFLVCSIFLGFPLLYLELLLGQYLQAPPTTIFYRLMPALQGIAWTMATVGFLVSTYYNVILAWSGVYLAELVMGKADAWTDCTNSWNKQHCIEIGPSSECFEASALSPIFYNDSCVSRKEFSQLVTEDLPSYISGAGQNFRFNILGESPTIVPIGSVQMKLFAALLIMWCFVLLGLFSKESYVKKMTWVVATIPFLLISILLIHTLFLPGAFDGLHFYFGFSFTELLSFQVWRAAFSQVCFSLCIGFGGLMTMASGNKEDRNCLRDAFVVFGADVFMSLLGGAVVFGGLGYIHATLDKPIVEAVSSGSALPFVAYTEVISSMPVFQLWAFFFFLTIILLGINTQMVYIRTMCTCFLDQFSLHPSSQPALFLIVTAIAFAIGSIMCTPAGIYFVHLFDNYCASFSLCAVVLVELLLVMYFYGIRNVDLDIVSIFGAPTTTLGGLFGKSGLFFKLCWAIFAPLLTVIALNGTLSFSNDPFAMGFGKARYEYPIHFKYLGRAIGILPILFVPVLFVGNFTKFLLRGRPLAEVFRIQPGHRSYWRVRGKATPRFSLDISNKKSFLAV